MENLEKYGFAVKENWVFKSIGLKINDEICFGPLKVAEKFNTFFSTMASSLVEKLPNCSGKFGKSYVKDYYQKLWVHKDYFAVFLLFEENVLKYLLKLGANKATGLGGIPARFIKDSASIVTVPITHIINLSMITGVVPDDLNSARVVPLF